MTDSFAFSDDELMQNYPNPFNPTTKIKYQIVQGYPFGTKNKNQINNKNQNSIFVSLKVYDILGREVATLVNKKQAPGAYEIIWNAEIQPSGVYFYSLNVGDFHSVKKMSLIK